MKTFLLAIIITSSVLSSCATSNQNNFREFASVEESPLSIENAEWDQYVKSIKVSHLQNSCAPRKFLPPEGVKIKGKLLLAHGFTACPQQYFEWAEVLSKRGIVVYLFLMPGHGKIKFSNGKDNFKDLPEHNDYKNYEKLAEIMNKVALGDDLPSSIGGLSVGGAVALNAASRASVPYEKLILFSPFFKIPSFFQRHLIGPLAGNIPFLKNKEVGWGEGCHDELKRGRAGLCEFTISQVYTNQVYGKYVMSIADHLSPVTLVQIVGVEDDKAADNGATKKIAHTIGFKKEEHVSACFYPKGANHSLLSRFDAPNENKFWLASLLENATNFVVLGKKIPAKKASLLEKEFHVCDVR